jgi:hypothetical protein
MLWTGMYWEIVGGLILNLNRRCAEIFGSAAVVQVQN